MEGRVVGVSDGDTLTVLDSAKVQQRVRLAGCDAPGRRQPFSERAKQNLSALAFDRRAEAACYKRVCRVAVAGRDVCMEQVRAGLAWHFKRFASGQKRGRASRVRPHRGPRPCSTPRPRAGREASAVPWEWRAIRRTP